MKKRLVIIIVAVAVLALGIVGVIFEINENSKEQYADEWYFLDHNIQSINNELYVDIIVYGEDFDFREGFKYRKIDKITEEALGVFDGEYKVLIVLDMNGNAELSDDEMLLVKKCCEEKYMDMIYLGTDKLERFEQLKFSIGFDEDEAGFEYIGSIYSYSEPIYDSNSNNYVVHGGYSKSTLEDTKNLQETMTWTICHYSENYYKAQGIFIG